jgi:hypothetical protein
MAARELAPGDAKKNGLLLETVDDVRKPVAVKVDISGGVKSVPGTVVDVGLVLNKEIYLATMISLVKI